MKDDLFVTKEHKRIIKFNKKLKIKDSGIHYIEMNHKNNVQTSIEEFEVIRDLMKVHEWRRGYKTKPPLVEINSKYDPKKDNTYRDVDSNLPLGESLEDVVERVESTLNEIIKLSQNNNVLVVAHGNSIRAILKIIENISDESIVDVNVPTGIPLAFNTKNDKITKIGYLGSQKVIEKDN